MKLLFLIISAFLSGLFCDRNVHSEDSKCGNEEIVVESKGQNQDSGNPDYKLFGLLPSSTAGYSGENQPSGRVPFRVIKDGKVIDRHNFCTFQTSLKKISSGIHSTDRYIHSLCQLLI